MKKTYTLNDSDITVIATGKMENAQAIYFETTEGTCGVLLLEPARAKAVAHHILRILGETDDCLTGMELPRR